MLLPSSLRNAIAELTEPLQSAQQKIESSKKLSSSYKTTPEKAFKNDPNSRLIYLITRLPATFAVLSHVFFLFLQKRKAPIESLLDLGCGPATALWALQELQQTPSLITCVEKDEKMLELAKALYSKVLPPFSVNWLCKSLTEDVVLQTPHDVVLLSYVLNEIPEALTPELFERLEKLTRSSLILIEPGTPDGYQRLLLFRKFALQRGWSILAPCPHHLECPLAKTKRWCHFYQRVQRTKEHKLAKEGSLGYEDEKFCYLILVKELSEEKKEPILSFPKVYSGFIELDICSKSGKEEKRKIFKKDKSLYKAAKKWDWGDWI